MEFSTFFWPLISQCRQKYGEWSLMLEIKSIFLEEAENIKLKKIATGEVEEEGSLRIEFCGKVITAKTREVRYKVSEACHNLSKHLSTLLPCKHSFQFSQTNIEIAFSFCKKNHSETLTKLRTKAKNGISDLLFLKILGEVFSYHKQYAKDLKIFYVHEVAYPIAMSSEFYILCEDNSESSSTIRVFDINGWVICEILDIRFSVINDNPVKDRSTSLKKNSSDTFPILPSSIQDTTKLSSNKKSVDLCCLPKKNTECGDTLKNGGEIISDISGMTYENAVTNNTSFEPGIFEQSCHQIQSKTKHASRFVNDSEYSHYEKHYRRIEDEVYRILRSFTEKDFNKDISFTHLGLDSFQIAEFEAKLKLHFDNHFDIPDGCAFENKNIPSLTQFLFQKFSRKSQNSVKSLLKTMTKTNQKVPLSRAQHRLVFMAKFDAENENQFLESFSIRCKNFELQRLGCALNKLIARQNILRTMYRTDSQTVLSLTESYVCLVPQSPPKNTAKLNIFEQPPIMFYLQKEETTQKLTIIKHHIMTDGVSVNIFLNELKDLYEGNVLEELNTCYAEYAIREKMLLEDQSYIEPRQSYWSKIFINKSIQHIRTDKPRLTTNVSHRGGCVRVTLQQRTIMKLMSLRSNSDVTLFSCLVAIFYILIHHLYNINDYCIGITATQRNNLLMRSVAGCFVNLVPIRAKVEQTRKIKHFIKEISEIIFRSTINQLPFDSLLKTIKYEGQPVTPGLFQVMLVMDDFHLRSSPLASSLETSFSYEKEEIGYAKYDQVWYFESFTDNSLTICVEYNSSLFYKKTIELLTSKYLKLIDEVSTQENKNIKDLKVHNSFEEMSFFSFVKKNRCDFPKSNTSIELLQKQLKKKFYYSCIQYKDLVYSTVWLTTKAHQLATSFQCSFLQHYGESVRPDCFAVMIMNRSPEMIAVLLGLWESGVAVVPLNIDWPPDLLKNTIESLKFPPIIFSKKDFSSELFFHMPCIVIDVNRCNSRLCHNFKQKRLRQYVNNLSYITLTSGTTDTPKSVCTEFLGLNNLTLCYTETLTISAKSSVYQVVNQAFDIFFADVLEAFTNGAKLVLAENKIPKRSELNLATHAYIMPAYLACLEDETFACLQKLSKLHFGGESVQFEFLRKIIDMGVDSYQQYGLTEFTIYSTLHRIKDKQDLQTIGKPIKNTFLITKSENGFFYYPSLQGKCSVFGVGLSRGYFDRESTNRNTFKSNIDIFSKDMILRNMNCCLETKDILQLDVDKNGKFCGRSDKRVKIRGMFVDVKEIENYISKQRHVRCCTVVVVSSTYQNTYLGACITVDHTAFDIDKEAICKKITSELSKKIPDYMIPSKIIVLDKIPITSNGKTDTKEVQKIIENPSHLKKTKTSLCENNSRLFETIHVLLLETIGKNELNLEDSFFEAGGDSLKALLFQEKVENALSIKFNIKEIFHLQTIHKIIEKIIVDNCSQIDLFHNKQKLGRHSVTKQEDSNLLLKEGIPLSFQQEGLWIVTELSNANHDSYLLHLKIEIDCKIKKKVMRNLLNQIVIKHAALRTIIAEMGKRMQQIILSGTESYLSVNDNEQKRNRKQSKLNGRRPLEVQTVWRNQKTNVLLRIHHFVIDGHSLQIIKKDFLKYYKALDKTKTSHYKTENKVQNLAYALYSINQRNNEEKFLKLLEENKKALLSAKPLKLAYDFPETSNLKRTAGNAVMPLLLPLNLLEQFCYEHKCSTFALLLAGYAILMKHLSGLSTFAVAMPVVNRSVDTEEVVGFFTNTVILNIDVTFDNIDQLLASIQNAIFESLRYQQIPFELCVRILNPNRRDTTSSFLHYSVVMQEAPQRSMLKDGNVKLKFDEIATNLAKFYQTWVFAKSEKNFLINVEYYNELFCRYKIKHEIAMYRRIISTLINSMKTPMYTDKNFFNGNENVEFPMSQLMANDYQRNQTDTNEKSKFKKNRLGNVSPLLESYPAAGQEKQNRPNTEIEKQIQKVWEKFLGRSVSVDDNFFAVGGHSLLAAQVCFIISNELNCSCSLKMLFENQTIEELAARLSVVSREVSVAKKTQHSSTNSFIIPVCDLQKPILEFYLNYPNANSAYITGFTTLIKKPKYQNLHKALNSVVMAHSALRMSFLSENGDYCQTIHSGTECCILTRLSRKVEYKLAVSLHTIPIACFIEKLGENLQLKLLLSHLIADYQSIRIIANDLSKNYHGTSKQRKQRSNYIEFTRKYQKSVEKNKDNCESYWKKTIQNIKVEGLTICSKNPSVYDYRCSYLHITFPKLNNIVRNIAQNERVSTYAVMLAAFGEVLFQRTLNENKILIACPFDLRSQFEYQSVGFYINTLPILMDFSTYSTPLSKIQTVFKQLQSAYDHSMVSTDFIREFCLNGQPLKVMITTETIYQNEDTQLQTIKKDGEDTGFAKYELTFFVKQYESDIELKIEFMKTLFNKESMLQLANDWAKSISKLTKSNSFVHPHIQRKISDNPTKAISKLVEQSCKLGKKKVSLMNKKRTLTYAKLLTEIEYLAKLLAQAIVSLHGEFLRNDTVVPIIAEKSLKIIILCLAVLSGGGSYLPIDQKTPLKRISKILQNIDANFYLANVNLEIENCIPLILQCNKLCSKINQASSRDRCQFNNIGYTIFTSGTTGEPKGAVIDQKNVVNLGIQSTQNFFISVTDCVYQFTNYCFDNSVLEIIMSLFNGCRLFVKEDAFTPELFVEEINDYKITHALLFPSLIDIFSEKEILELRKLRYWIVGAEKLSQKTMLRALLNGTRIIQNYGPTETTAYTLYKYMHLKDHPNNLGKPISNVNVWVSGQTSEKSPTFAIGELIVEGINLMRGYTNVPILNTNQQAMKHQYSTGDLVRQYPDGNLIFIGRHDQQVKLRGFRIELTEIESTLLEVSNVRQAKVILKKPEKILVAYLVPLDSKIPFDLDKIRDSCKMHLPYYMVPTHFREIEALPLTNNAKIDLQKLQAIELINSGQRSEKPYNDFESKILKIFNGIFDNDYISVTDDFFLLGGNSLLAKKLVTLIEKELNVPISVSEIFEHKTIRNLTKSILTKKQIKKQVSINFNEHSKAVQKTDFNRVPLSYEQQQMYYLNNAENAYYYNVVHLQHFSNTTNFKHLRYSFQRLIVKQPSLRTIFREHDYTNLQYLLSGTETYFLVDYEVSKEKFLEEIKRAEKELFDIATMPPLKCLLCKEKNIFTISVIINHIISDGWSTRLIETELKQLYTTPFSHYWWKQKLEYTYADYATEQQKEENRKKFEEKGSIYAAKISSYVISYKSLWSNDLQTADHLSNFQTFSSSLNPKEHVELLKASSVLRSSPSLFFLAALALTLHTTTTYSTIIIAMVADSRTDTTSNIVGNFLNTLLVPSSYYKANDIINYLTNLKNFIDFLRQYETVPYPLLLTSLRKRIRKKFIPEILFNCRYDIEDGSTNYFPRTETPSMSKCINAIEMDVDLINHKFMWTVRIHNSVIKRIDRENFVGNLQNMLLNLIDTVATKSVGHVTSTQSAQVNFTLSDVGKTLQGHFISDTEINHKLKKIWKECFFDCEFSSTDDFFFIGGNSLLCMKLQKMILSEFSISITLNELFNNSSFKAMCELIRKACNSANQSDTNTVLTNYFDDRILLKLNSSKKKNQLLVFIHPLVGGVVFPYAHLIKELDMLNNDLTIMGIQHPNTFDTDNMSSEFSASIEDLCKAYVSNLIPLITNFHKCVFIGASLGGILCYECALQMSKKGVTVQKIICIDTEASPNLKPNITFEQHVTQTLTTLELFSKTIRIHEELKDAIIRNSWELLKMRAVYVPKPDPSIKVTLLKTENERSDYGWSKLCQLQKIMIEGTHSTMMQSPNAKKVAEIISDLL